VSDLASSRTRWKWFVVGAIAAMGAFSLSAAALTPLHLDGIFTALLSAAVAGAAVGAMMTVHSSLRPWREPPLAVGLGMGTFCAGIFGLSDLIGPLSHAPSAWLVAVGSVAISVAASVGGSFLAKRSTLRAPSRPTLVLLSALLLMGLALIAFLVFAAAGSPVHLNDDHGKLAVVGFAAMLGGSFATQLVAVRRDVWFCSMGAVVTLIANNRTEDLKLSSILAIPFSVAIATIGARLASRLMFSKTGESEAPSLPGAKLQ
jgi:hypothetical protein